MMNCTNCGRFMTKQAVTESELDPNIYQWWSCKCGNEYPELIWDKATWWNKPELIVGSKQL